MHRLGYGTAFLACLAPIETLSLTTTQKYWHSPDPLECAIKRATRSLRLCLLALGVSHPQNPSNAYRGVNVLFATLKSPARNTTCAKLGSGPCTSEPTPRSGSDLTRTCVQVQSPPDLRIFGRVAAVGSLLPGPLSRQVVAVAAGVQTAPQTTMLCWPQRRRELVGKGRDSRASIAFTEERTLVHWIEYILQQQQWHTTEEGRLLRRCIGDTRVIYYASAKEKSIFIQQEAKGLPGYNRQWPWTCDC